MNKLSSALQHHRKIAMLVLVIILIMVALLSLFVGRYAMNLSVVFTDIMALIKGNISSLEDSTALSVLVTMRLPRMCFAMLIGAGLSAAGAAFQGIFKNPMVSPDLLGASAGAGFGAALAILIGFGLAGVHIIGFLFGVLAVLCAYVLSRVVSRSLSGVLTLVLSGIVIANLFQALIGAVKYMADPNSTLPEITFWLMGGLSTNAKLENLLWLVIAFVIGCIGLMCLRWRMNVLAMGDEEASSLGVDVTKSRILIIAAATLLTASATAMAGMVGWVGLIIPHLARAVVGSDHRALIPASMLLGAAFLLVVDDLCRSIYTTEIPLSIVTAIVGVPLFIYLISHMQGGIKHE